MMNRSWWSLPLGVVIGLLTAGLVLLMSRPSRGASVLLRPPPTPPPLMIAVDGCVHSPGVYALARNSRVRDAVQAAGGYTAQADTRAVNLAAALEDGDHLIVPERGQPAPAGSGQTQELLRSPTPAINLFPIDINRASQEELEALPGIGPVTAEKIIRYREEQPFTRIEEIQKVPGIGPATYQDIRSLIRVSK
jgi:competence protein ComEA